MTGERLLDIEDLRVSFPSEEGRIEAVRGVSYGISDGEVLAIAGESGSGKSVASLAVMGLLPEHARVTGSIRLQGRELLGMGDRELSALRGKTVSMVFQDPLSALTPVYRVGDQIAEALLVHGRASNRKEAAQRAVDLLDLVGIPDPAVRAKAFPHEFSGGMRQRVVIALALAAEPKLIVADEPTTALDVSIQAQIIELLKKLCREHGASVMLITHDMGVIAETADRVAVMYAGRVVEIGPVSQVIHHPAHPYSAGLMGSIPTLDRHVQRLVQIDGSMPRLTAIPPGCAFNPRCSQRMERCTRERPELLPAGPTQAACWLHDQEVTA